MSLYRTNRTPCRHRRSGTGRGPGALSGQAGNNGSINAHSSSSTIHGRMLMPCKRPDHHTGHALPGHPYKILLHALNTLTNTSR